MPIIRIVVISFLILFLLPACKKKDENIEPEPGSIQLVSVSVGADNLSFSNENVMLPIDQPIVVRFNSVLDTTTTSSNLQLDNVDRGAVAARITYLDNHKTISLKPLQPLEENKRHTVNIGAGLKDINNKTFKGLKVSFTTEIFPMNLREVRIDTTAHEGQNRFLNAKLIPTIEIHFSHGVALDEIKQHVGIYQGSLRINSEYSQLDEQSFEIVPNEKLKGLTKYTISISPQLKSEADNPFNGYQTSFFTRTDSSPKFPIISDDALLTHIQAHTFKYFWDFGHPVSGMARERNTSEETVTSGGTGFGLMAILVGIERGFITRSEGITRLNKIVEFLETADRFHGAWSHWLDGTTGKAKPFSAKDDGGDLVETSFLTMGLLTVKQYLDTMVVAEKELRNKITSLWEEIEWNWYQQNNKDVLYWHWSPRFAWEMNLPIRGYNEALVSYVLAAASPTHGVPAEVYHRGWAKEGNISNGNRYYGINLPIGQEKGGPLFFSHYSFLGLNPHDLQDTYANYWEQNVNHTKINRAYCVANPKNYVGYNEHCWGLTASDGNKGYSAHSPTNDRGVIAPTAAIASIPYTPNESLEAIKFFYYTLGDRLWGEYGFYDAFNLTEGWVADSYLAIDQGPIVVMIENYRSSLLWDLFMSDTDVQNGLSKLGFNSTNTAP